MSANNSETTAGTEYNSLSVCWEQKLLQHYIHTLVIVLVATSNSFPSPIQSADLSL